MAEKDPEMEHNHIIQITCFVAIATALIIDSLLGIFDLGTTPLLAFIPWYVRLILFGIFLFFALTLILRSHKALFGGYMKGHTTPDHLITDGIFEQVRHPMYVGTILIYFSLVLLTASLLGLGMVIGIALIYNFTIMDDEEKALEEFYGEKYHEYKKTTRKWEIG